MRAATLPRTRARVIRAEDDRNTRPSRTLDRALVIDCRTCKCAQDLADPACMRCALGSLREAPSVEKVVLSRSLDVAYEGRCVQVLHDLAEAVRICRAGAPPSLDRTCQSCGSNPCRVLDRMADSIPYGWTGHAPTVAPSQSGGRCASCAEQLGDVLSTVGAKLRSIERSVSRDAFMVVGE